MGLAEGEVPDSRGLLEVAGDRTVFSTQAEEEPCLVVGEVRAEVALLEPLQLVQIP